MTIHHRNIQLAAVEMFKVKNGLSSEMMDDLFQLNTRKNTFVIPRAKTEYMGKLSLRWFGPWVWETMLPESYKNVVSLEAFKQRIKKWIPDNCECRLCKLYVANVGFVKTR